MPKAKPFSRSDVKQRAKKPLVDPALTEKLVEIAGAASTDTKEKLRHKLNCTVSAFFARRRGDKQESPARIVAALKPGLKPARKLLAWLDTLPVGVLIELQAGGVKEFCERVIDCEAYWRGQVKTHRPAGEGAASLDLRLSLKDIYDNHCVGLRNKIPEERERHLNDLVTQASKMIGARYPNEREHRGRFMGEQKRPSKRGPRLYVRPLQKSAVECELERKLGKLEDI